jgi:hypothetical protein
MIIKLSSSSAAAVHVVVLAKSRKFPIRNDVATKPVTRHYGYGLLAGENFRTRTQTRDLNPRETRGFTHTRVDH